MKENLHKSFSWEVYFGKNNSHLIHWKSVYLTLPKNVVSTWVIIHSNPIHMRMVHHSTNKDTLSSKQWYIIIKTILL